MTAKSLQKSYRILQYISSKETDRNNLAHFTFPACKTKALIWFMKQFTVFHFNSQVPVQNSKANDILSSKKAIQIH